MLDTMKAAIFDMDGTLIDSMPAWRELNAAFVRSHGITPTKKQEEEMLSMSGTMVIDYYKREFGLETDFAALCDAACRAMEQVYLAGVPLKPGAGEYLRRLKARGVKCVLATATPAKQALMALNRMNLVGELDYIFSTDMIGTGKSNPAFFDLLCERIGEKKEDCVMFEDALYAMQGARAAGLGVVGITDSTNGHDIPKIREVCDVLIDSYDELE